MGYNSIWMNVILRELLEYETENGRCPFSEWLDGDTLVVLLYGGDKGSQGRDIQKPRNIGKIIGGKNYA